MANPMHPASVDAVPDERIDDDVPLRRRPLSDSTVRVFEPRRPGIGFRLAELWRYRRVTGYFARRYIRKGYGRTWLGWVWLPLKPLLHVGTRILIFGGLLGAPSDGIPYALFLLVGTSVWHMFDVIAMFATRSIEVNRRVLNRAYVPRLTAVVATVAPGLVQFGLYFLITVGAAVYYRVSGGSSHVVFGPATLLAPAGIVLLILMALGVGLWLAPFSPQARDVRWGLRHVLSFLYFVTPVIYPLSAVPPKYKRVAELNPLTAPMEMIRHAFFGVGTVPALSVAVCLGSTFVVLASGLWFFGRAESTAIDSI